MANTAFVSLARGRELLSGLDPSLVMWIHSNTQIAVGAVPLQAQYLVDLGTEEVRNCDAMSVTQTTHSPLLSSHTRSRLLRRGGKYLFELQGAAVECGSLRELLRKGLLAIEEKRPGMLDALTKEKARTKRIVARRKDDLFEDPELVSKFADKLADGWWYGTNNSAQETRRWLKRACELAKLQWGRDFDTTV